MKIQMTEKQKLIKLLESCLNTKELYRDIEFHYTNANQINVTTDLTKPYIQYNYLNHNLSLESGTETSLVRESGTPFTDEALITKYNLPARKMDINYKTDNNFLSVNFSELPKLSLKLCHNVSEYVTIKDYVIDEGEYGYVYGIFWRKKIKKTELFLKQRKHTLSYELSHGEIQTTLSFEEGQKFFKMYKENKHKFKLINDMDALDKRLEEYGK